MDTSGPLILILNEFDQRVCASGKKGARGDQSAQQEWIDGIPEHQPHIKQIMSRLKEQDNHIHLN